MMNSVEFTCAYIRPLYPSNVAQKLFGKMNPNVSRRYIVVKGFVVEHGGIDCKKLFGGARFEVRGLKANCLLRSLNYCQYGQNTAECFKRTLIRSFPFVEYSN